MRGFGYRPDPYDPHAPRYGLPTSAPAELSLRELAPPLVLDQGILEECVGAGLVEVAYGMQVRENLDPVLGSMGFIWWNARKQLGDEQQNVGTYPSVAVQTLNDLGLCPEVDWPASSDFSERPSMLAYEHAYDSRFGIQPLRLDADEGQIKSAMVTHGPLGFGMPVCEGYVELGAHDLVTGPVGEFRGNHYQSIFGFDADGVDVLNHWGPGWGNAGWARISWGYLLSVASDIVCFKYVPRIGD